MPNTINYDDIQKKVQQYQQYYQQLMNSYSGNSTTSAEVLQKQQLKGNKNRGPVKIYLTAPPI